MTLLYMESVLSLNSSRFLLTFEWDSKREVLEIHGDQRGLEKLRNAIDVLLAKTANDHTHLMTVSGGGNDLSDEQQCLENEIIHHVKLFKWVKN